MNEEEKKAVEKLTNREKVTIQELMRKMKKEGVERFVITRPEYIYTILNLIEKLQKENEKINSLIKKLKEDSKEQQWIQTADDEYLASTDKAMYADELLSFLRGEE